MKKTTNWSKEVTTAPAQWAPTTKPATSWTPDTEKLPTSFQLVNKLAASWSADLPKTPFSWSNDDFTLDALIGSGTIGGGFIGRPL